MTSNHEDTVLIPGLAQWVKYLALLWLWCRPAAEALICTPILYATCAALKSKKKKNPKNKQMKTKKQSELQVARVPLWLSGLKI